MKTRLLSMAFILGVSAFGTAQAQDSTAPRASTDGVLASLIQGSARVETGKRLVLNEDAVARLYKSLDGAETGGNVSLDARQEFEVLEISRDGKVARLGLDTENQSASDIFVSVADLEQSRLAEVKEIAGLEDEDVDVSDEGLFAATRKKGGMTYCYRDVKNTLLKNKKCGRYASGVRAAEGYQILARECGMTQVGKVEPSTLPAYSVCVSSGGRPCGGGTYCGHIAVKLPNGLWFGAGTRGTPYLPNSKKKGYAPRKITGCLKPKGA